MTIWAFDIETEDWDTFVLGAAVSESGEVIELNSDDDARDFYLNLPAGDEVIAHNGGAFDFLYLISTTPDLAWSATMAGSSIVTCRAKGHALCRDTFRLFPLSLRKWTQSKTDTGLVCRCGQKCGGYCAIRRDMGPRLRRRLMDYCVNDARVLLRTWISDVARLEADGLLVWNDRGKMRSTIGGVAWASGATMAGLDPNALPDWGDYDAGRRAYYGGRVEVGRVQADLGYRYDVHAMYPWALTHDVPHGERHVHTERAAARCYDRNELALFWATVDVPASDLPPLPHRYDGPRQGRLFGERLLWATGEIEGSWSGVELRHAEKCGARIVTIHQADEWSDRSPLFKPYVEHVYARRRHAIDAGDDRWGAVLKWFANSLSGKLAQRPGVSRLAVLGKTDDPLEGWVQHGGLDSRVYSYTTTRVPASGMTWAAATLTARSRVKLHERLWRNTGAWLYCDTDSTYLLNRDQKDVHESKLGMWGYEGKAVDWHALAPKLYRYRDEDGAPHVRARGVPRASWETYERLRRGFSVEADGGVERIRTSGGAFTSRTVKRSHRDVGSSWCGTRHVTPGGATRPLHRLRDGRYI